MPPVVEESGTQVFSVSPRIPLHVNTAFSRSSDWQRTLWAAAATLWAAALLLGSSPAAADPPTLSGRWQASSMRSAWNIGDWGKACGPKPQSAGAGAGVATVTQTGGELSIQGPTRSYSTTQCWEQFPGMSVASHTGGKRGWRTICRTAAGDPRQATITTNITATDTYINFDEVGQYQFVVKKQNCTASVRRSRTFRLIQRVGEPSEAEKKKALEAEAEPPAEVNEEPEPEPQPEAEPPTPKKASPSGCAAPGPPARLEVRPAKKLIRSGETFSFRATVLDANGCRLTLAPEWKLAGGEAGAKLLGPGRVQIAQDAPEGPVHLQASIGERSVTVQLQVVSGTKYEELLRTDDFDARGESKGAAVAIIASGEIKVGKAVTKERDRHLELIILGLLGLVAVVLGGVGIALARRSRKPTPQAAEQAAEPPAPATAEPEVRMVCPTCGQDYPRERSFCPRDGNRLVPAQPNIGREKGGVCPTCGQGYDPGTERCPHHGEVLVPPTVYRSIPPGEARPSGKICPICGTQYPGDAGFCGRDGAQLVPVN